MGNPKHYKLQLIGLGPAGLGFIVAADRSGKMHELLKQGMLIVDKKDGEHFGSGSLSRYHINSFSPGDTFVSNISSDGIFSKVVNDEYSIVHAMHFRGGESVPLPVVAKLMQEMGACLRDIVSKGYNNTSKILTDTKVNSIHWEEIGGKLQWKTMDEFNQPIGISDTLIITCGSQESILRDLSPLFSNQEEPIANSEWERKTLLSGDVLDQNGIEGLFHIAALQKERPIMILGGTQSGFAVAWKILDYVDNHNRQGIKWEPKIILAYRIHSCKECYPNKLANQTQTNFVGNNKEDAKSLFDNVMQGLEHRLTFFGILDNRAVTPFCNLLNESSVIVQAFNYKPRVVPIFKDGKRMDITVTSENVIDNQTGKQLPHILTLNVPTIGVQEKTGVCQHIHHDPVGGLHLYQGILGQLLVDRVTE